MSTTKTRESIEEREERELYASCALSPCEFFFDFNKLPLVTEPTLTEIRNRWLSASQGDWCWDVEFEVGAPYIGKAPRLASWLRDGRIITRVLLTLFKGDGERDIVLHLHDPHGITDADVALLGFAHTDIGRLLGVIHRQRKLLRDPLYLKWLKEMPYSDYLQTEHWQFKRRCALDVAGGACQLCNSKERLEVHHRTYDRRGDELPTDLTVLCHNCHSGHHGKGHQREG